MKKLLILIFTLLSATTFGQYTPNYTKGFQFKGLKADSALYLPTFNGLPDIKGGVFYKNSAIAFDSTNNKVYYFNPKDSSWNQSPNYIDVVRLKDSQHITGLKLMDSIKLSIINPYIYADSGNRYVSFMNNDTYIGYGSGKSIVLDSSVVNPFSGQVGHGNTALGYWSLRDNTIGEENTAIGYRALAEWTGFRYTNMTDRGGDFTALGYRALDGVTTGGATIGIGNGAGAHTNNISKSVLIGDMVYHRFDHSITDSTIGLIAIGNGAAQDKLINNSIVIGNAGAIGLKTGNKLITIGDISGKRTIGGSLTNTSLLGHNIVTDLDSIVAIGSLSQNIILGNSDSFNLYGLFPSAWYKNKPTTKVTINGDLSITKIDSVTVPTTNYLSWNSLTGKLQRSANPNYWIKSGSDISYNTGNVGIGTTTPISKLDVAGDINFTGKLFSNGSQVLYQPSAYNGTLIIGNGGGSLTHSTSTEGYYNTFVGINSGYANTIGSYNTALGFYSLTSNTTGNYNTAVGRSALTSNTTGNNNTANGYGSLFYNTTGNSNTANGYGSLNFNTTGNNNTANGYGSLFYNTTGNYNTAQGYQAGFGSSGASDINGNSLFGYRAGYNLLTGGDYNTLLGSNAGSALTTGARNIIIGYNAQAASSTGNDQLNIGNAIYGNLSTGQIGIGTSTPTEKLEVVGNIKGTSFIKSGGTSSQMLMADGSTKKVLTYISPLNYSTDTLRINKADSTNNGYLSSTDWNTFNNKPSGLTAIKSVSSGTYNIVLSDLNKRIILFGNTVITVPTDASVSLEIGSKITFEAGDSSFNTFVPMSGVTINSRNGWRDIDGFAGVVELVKTAANTWNLSRDITKIEITNFSLDADWAANGVTDKESFSSWLESKTSAAYLYVSNFSLIGNTITCLYVPLGGGGAELNFSNSNIKGVNYITSEFQSELIYLYFHYNQIDTLNLTKDLPHGLLYLQFDNNQLDQASVDAQLHYWNNLGRGADFNFFIQGGTNSTPSATGLVDKSALQGRGATVNTN